MTRAELRTLTLQTLDDLNAGYFTTDIVNTWINNAQREVQKRLVKAGQNYYLRCVQTTLIVNQRDYILPMDLKKINRLDIIISGTPPNESQQSLTPITLNQQDLVSVAPGTPRVYGIKKNKVTLYPTPDTALTMRMNYTYLVSDMTLDTDVVDVPDSYAEYVYLLAAVDGFIKDGRAPELLMMKIGKFEKDMDMDANERRQDMSREIRELGDTTFSSGSGW